MHIVASAVQFESVRSHSALLEVSESLRIQRERPANAGHLAPVIVAQDETATAGANAINNAIEEAVADPYLRLLVSLIEHLTGRQVRVLAMQRPSPDFPEITSESIVAAEAPGWGVVYRKEVSFTEAEHTVVTVQGRVRAADGRDISFSMILDMSRVFSMRSSETLTIGNPQRQDPLVLSFDGNAAALSPVRFRFDLNGDGQSEDMPQLIEGQGFLVFDRNGNGQVDHGHELFGPRTGNGYAELASLDSDGNGWIDERDTAYRHLGVWLGGNGGKVYSLPEMNVGALFASGVNSPFSLRSPDNQELGAVRATGIYLTESGVARPLQQIDLVI